MPEQTQTLTATIERAFEEDSPIDPETGEFPLVLATQGESSDGHILHIEGVSAPERMPLQIDHSNSALRTLGSIFDIRATRKGSLPVLKAIGRIELGGEGEQAAIRRDVANMIAQGHLSAVSVRARGDKVIARTDLPTSHPYHVSSGEKDLAKRFGAFFEKSTLLEGSIVALGADKRAIIGRSLDEPVSQFWTEFLAAVEPAAEPAAAAQREVVDFAQVIDIRSLERLLRDVGASHTEAKRIIALCKGDSPRDVERTEQPKTPEISVRDVQNLLASELAGLKTEIFRECSAILRSALGKVDS